MKSYLVDLLLKMSQQISIIGTHIPPLRLLILRQPQIPRRLVPLPVLPGNAHGIHETTRRRQTYEGDADTIPGVEELELIVR